MRPVEGGGATFGKECAVSEMAELAEALVAIVLFEFVVISICWVHTLGEIVHHGGVQP